MNPRKLEPFIEAYQSNYERLDYAAWLNGLYTKMAIASIMPRGIEYPERPLSKQEKKSDPEINNDATAAAGFAAFAAEFNKRFIKGDENSGNGN